MVDQQNAGDPLYQPDGAGSDDGIAFKAAWRIWCSSGKEQLVGYTELVAAAAAHGSWRWAE